MNKQELIKDLQAGNYHLSPSSLKAFADQPRKFLQYKLEDKPETPALSKGTIIHKLILEPHIPYAVFDESQKPVPDKDYRTKANKEWKAAFFEENKNKMIVTDKQISIRDAVLNNAISGPLLHNCQTEVEIHWNEGDIAFKGIVDALNRNYFIDIKTTGRCKPDKLRWQRKDYGYDLQMCLYWRALKRKKNAYIIWAGEDGSVVVNKYSLDTLCDISNQIDVILAGFQLCLEEPDQFNCSYEFWQETGYYLI